MLAVWKFHLCLCGRQFRMVTGHKPLLGLLGEDKVVPQLASGRLIRWALMLSRYQYKLLYVHGSQNVEADALSWLPLGTSEREIVGITEKMNEVCAVFEYLDSTAITSDHMHKWTKVDPLPGPISSYLHAGRPAKAGNVSEFRPFWNRQNDLWLADGCVILGSRTVISQRGPCQLLKELHTSYPRDHN